MPLNDHEQKILEEIERRLSEEDPRLVEQVSRTSLHTHAWARMKMAMVGFAVGLLLLLLIPISVWISVVGFVLMTLSALLAYRYAGRLGDDGVAPGTFGRLASRVAGRLRRPASGLPPEE
jgi:hypothetical protein